VSAANSLYVHTHARSLSLSLSLSLFVPVPFLIAAVPRPARSDAVDLQGNFCLSRQNGTFNAPDNRCSRCNVELCVSIFELCRETPDSETLVQVVCFGGFGFGFVSFSCRCRAPEPHPGLSFRYVSVLLFRERHPGSRSLCFDLVDRHCRNAGGGSLQEAGGRLVGVCLRLAGRLKHDICIRIQRERERETDGRKEKHTRE
jgi:hypothetical protein